MIEYNFETLSDDLVKDIEQLLHDHWEEVALYKDKIPLDPDWAKYRTLEASNAFYALIARKDGKIIGYNAAFVVRHPHYNVLIGQNDVIYVDPEHRHSRVPLKLVHLMDEALKIRGCSVLRYHMKPHRDFSRMLSKSGYAVEEKLCMKYIGD